MTMRFLQTELGADPVTVEAIFPATPARVFKAWTDPDQILRWFGPQPGSLQTVHTELRVGGRWRFTFPERDQSQSSLEGEYTQIEPDTLLQFTWRHVTERNDGTREETPYSTVTVTLSAFGQATQLRLQHEGIEKSDGRKGVGRGWETTMGHLMELLQG